MLLGMTVSHSLYGQSSYTTEVNLLNSYFRSIPEESLLLKSEAVSTFDLYTRSFDTLKNTSQERVWLAKKDEIRKNHGLSIYGDMQWRAQSMPDDDNVNVSNSGYMRGGLQWNLIKDGFMHRKINGQIVDNEREIYNYSQEEEGLKRNYWWRYQHIIYEFNKRLKCEYEYYQYMLQDQQKIAIELYYKRLIPYTHILSLKHKLEVVQAQIFHVNTFNENYPYPTDQEVSLSLYEIDINKVIRELKPQASQASILALEYENRKLDLKKQNAIDLSVRLYHKASLLNDGTIQNSPTFACTVSVPLSKKSTELVDAELEMLRDEKALELNNRIKEIRILHYEYTYKIKQIKDMYYKSKLKKEQLLTDLFENQYIQVDTDIESLNRLNALIELKCEMIDVIRQMHLKALKIIALANIENDSIGEYTRLIKLNEAPAHKPIVEWDASKATKSSLLFMNYLKRNKLRYVYVSQADHSNYALVTDMLQKEGFYVLSQSDCQHATNHQVKELKAYRAALSPADSDVVINDIHTIISLEKKNIQYEKF